MTPEFYTLLSDVVKIFVPAAIAGYTGYKVAKIQLESKIKELERDHELKAREHIFNYYVERGKMILGSQGELNKNINEFIGTVVGFSFANEEDVKEYCRKITGLVLNFSANTSQQLQKTKEDLAKEGLSNTPEYKTIDSYIEELKKIEPSDSPSQVQKNLFLIREAYNHAYSCFYKLLEKEKGDKVFEKYLKE